MNQHVSERMTGHDKKVIRTGAVDGYQMTGWRYREDAVWHVKVWMNGHPGGWMGYTVKNGEFALKSGAKAHKEAISHMVREWDAETSAPTGRCLTVTG
jgi:hypothetical protein